jgi:hypothetical protein
LAAHAGNDRRKKLLLYEVHLTNFAPTDLTLTRIQVVDSTGAVLNDLKDSELQEVMGRFDHVTRPTDTLLIPPGVHALAYLSVPLTLGANPIGLTHRSSTRPPGIRITSRCKEESSRLKSNLRFLSRHHFAAARGSQSMMHHGHAGTGA